MILTVDIGNTNIVFGLYSGDVLAFNFRIQSDTQKTTDEYAALILYLFERNQVDITKIEGVIVASVVPSLQFTVSRFIKKYLNHEPMIVGSGVKTGVPIRMENPKEVGADRIVNAVAAIHKFGTPCVVVDFGTATTFDVVSVQGEYIGGVICPGVKLSAQMLHSNTAKLPEVSIQRPFSTVGKNTIHSMQSGIYFGYLSMVKGLLKLILEEEFVGCDNVGLILTGGLGSIFAPELGYDVKYEPHLTLYGLKIIYEKNSYIK